jgi:nitrate reductase cytochrome c-type subunit
MPRLFFTIALTAVTLLFAYPAFAHQLPEKFTFEDPSVCEGCHKAIYDEWAGSMHARSSAFGDPVHAAVYETFSKAMKAAGKPAPYFCANCHMPTADNIARLMKGEAVPDKADKTNVAGVTCSFCHKAEGLVEGERFHAYKFTEGLKGSGVKAPHELLKSDFTTSFKVCMGCHGKMVNAKGGVICSADEEGYSDCLTCHMPDTDGAPAVGAARTRHAFHGIFGGHDPSMLGKGATVTLGVELGRLLVYLKNPNPHFFPSTNPMRVAYVKVEITDSSGKLLFTNFVNNPSEDPGALMMKVFKAGDKTGVPSWDATGVASDTRLKANEERGLTYKLPDGAAKATAKLYYRFVPAAAIEKFGITPDGVVDKPQLVSEAAIEIKQ